jgi:spermidine/putrescine-binding protein
MRTKKITRVAAMLLAAAVSAGPMLAQSQADRHVVSLDELNKDAAKPAETRRANEAEIRHLFATIDGQKALKTANVEYAKIDRAVSSMSDEDVARISSRAREIDRDFAGGNLSDHDLLLILIIALIVIILIVVLR